MILVDKDIKNRLPEIFKDGYDEQYVSAISYDLHIESIITKESSSTKYTLDRMETIMVKMEEKISMPNDLIGRIAEKNSRIRQGLFVSGPHYQPGHNTAIYLRVQNISGSKITICRGDSIAQIIFEQLTQIPEKPYSARADSSFNDEDEYRGYAKYNDEYSARKEEVEDAENRLNNKVDDIYKNMIAIMGIFVSIFSFIIVNFSSIKSENLTKDFIIPMNISLGIVITLFMGLILMCLNKNKNKCFLKAYIALLIILIVLLLVVL